MGCGNTALASHAGYTAAIIIIIIVVVVVVQNHVLHALELEGTNVVEEVSRATVADVYSHWCRRPRSEFGFHFFVGCFFHLILPTNLKIGLH